ncbi:hypothetical protein GCM10020256_15180 [Streptomyces thermocoprophilus]
MRRHASAWRPVYRPVQPGGDAALGADADHLRHDESGAAEGAGAEVDEVEVAGDAVGGGVHVHRGDDDPVAQGEAAQPVGREHRRGAGRAAELPLHGGGEVRVAQPQVVVGDAAGAGEEVERELAGRLVDVEGEVLEPFEAGAGGPLGGGDDGPAFLLVGGEGVADGGLFVEAGGEGEGVLDGEFGAGADGEVRGVGGVAEQHHLAVGPAVVDDRAEAGPVGVVGAQRASAERVGEDLRAAVDGLLGG